MCEESAWMKFCVRSSVTKLGARALSGDEVTYLALRLGLTRMHVRKTLSQLQQCIKILYKSRATIHNKDYIRGLVYQNLSSLKNVRLFFPVRLDEGLHALSRRGNSSQKCGPTFVGHQEGFPQLRGATMAKAEPPMQPLSN